METIQRLIYLLYSINEVFNYIYYYGIYVLLVLCMVVDQTFQYCHVGVKFKQLNQEEINSFTSFAVNPPIEIIPTDFQPWISTHKCVSFCANHYNCTMASVSSTICYLMGHHTCGQPNINIIPNIQVWAQ